MTRRKFFHDTVFAQTKKLGMQTKNHFQSESDRKEISKKFQILKYFFAEN